MHIPSVVRDEVGRRGTLWGIDAWDTTITTLGYIAQREGALPRLEELHLIAHGDYQSDVPKPEALMASITPFFARDNFHLCFDLSGLAELSWERSGRPPPPAYCMTPLPDGHPMEKRIYIISNRHIPNEWKQSESPSMHQACASVLYTREGVETRYFCLMWTRRNWWSLEGPNIWQRLDGEAA